MNKQNVLTILYRITLFSLFTALIFGFYIVAGACLGRYDRNNVMTAVLIIFMLFGIWNILRIDLPKYSGCDSNTSKDYNESKDNKTVTLPTSAEAYAQSVPALRNSIFHDIEEHIQFGSQELFNGYKNIPDRSILQELLDNGYNIKWIQYNHDNEFGITILWNAFSTEQNTDGKVLKETYEGFSMRTITYPSSLDELYSMYSLSFKATHKNPDESYEDIVAEFREHAFDEAEPE